MSRLNGFVQCRASSYVQWGDVYISGTEQNMTLKFSTPYANLSDTS